jgi:putative tryptophan/tyrosine transport system substrate-binding protein
MQSDRLKRRELFALLGGAALAWPLTTRAQQSAMPVVGFLRSTAATGSAHLVGAFRQGLSEAGLVDGQNVAVEYRWADDQPDRLPGLVADLVQRRAAVIVANTAAAQAAKSAAPATPIIFLTGSDPVGIGLVASLSRPGGNITGVAFTTADLAAKRLGLLHELVPKAAVLAVLLDPNTPGTPAELRGVEEARRAIAPQIVVVNAAREGDFNAAFATIMQAGAGALSVGGGAFFLGQRRQIVAWVSRYGLPASYVSRPYLEVGGLMSYGPSQTDAYRRAAGYVGRILKGEKAGDLPVELASKFDLTINLPTAKGMGLEIPPMLLARADEVIE